MNADTPLVVASTVLPLRTRSYAAGIAFSVKHHAAGEVVERIGGREDVQILGRGFAGAAAR